MSYRCPRCRTSFPCRKALGGHLSKGAICPEVEANSTTSSIGAKDTTTSTDTTDSESEDLTSFSGSNDERSERADNNGAGSVLSADSGIIHGATDQQEAGAAVALPFVPPPPENTAQLLQRERGGTHRIVPSLMRPHAHAHHVVDTLNTYKLHQVHSYLLCTLT